MKARDDLEKRIEEVGLELYRLAADVPSIFDRRRWMGRVMDSSMRDEQFRLNLFRYIDVLPSLKTDGQITNLLQEYFSGSEGAPLIIRKGVERVSRGLIPFVASRLIKAGVKSLASQFIAGETGLDAQRTLGSLWKEGFASSVDLLGEEVLSDREADEYTASYLRLLHSLGEESRRWTQDDVLERTDKGPIPRFDISFKVTSLYSQLDPIDWEGSIERTRENLRPIIAGSRDSGASLCFDMEQYYCKDLIMEIFKQVMDEFEDYNFGGIALQAYLRESRKDLLGLVDWAKKGKRRFSVRLVKGAYWDYEFVLNTQRGWPLPVFESKEETDNNFEELTRILFENSEFVRPAIATHNIRSISHAIAAAESLRLPKNAFEFQMLYGMGEPLRKKLRDMGYRVRVYTPVGELIPGMAYLVRRLLENTSNTSFLRAFFSESRPFEELIKPPAPKSSGMPRKIFFEFRNEPAADFSKAENREMMRGALKSARATFAERYSLSIGGEDIFRDKEILSRNPADPDEIVGRVSSADRNNAEQAIRASRQAWDLWRNVAPEERAEYLFKAATEMRKRRFDFASIEVYEAGKTWKDADGDVIEAIDYLHYYGREMVRLGRPVRLGNYPGEINDYIYEPRGICLVISPWNFPLAISTGMVAAALVTGNCVIFKPSGLAPVTGWKLVEAFRNAGLPRGVLQYLPGPGQEVGEYLVTHREVDLIAFTGSKDVGLRIIRLAAETQQGQRNVKRVVAEMGGKNAVIIDDTADLNEAVKGILESSLGYQGQKCSACSRVVVFEGIYDEFLARMRDAMDSIRIGPPEDPGTYMGPVIDEDALKKIDGYIAKGKKDAVLYMEKKFEGKGHFLGPVLFKDVPPPSAIAQEEIFGPVISVIRAKNIDEAIDIANNTAYALTGGIFSRSPVNIRKSRERYRAGNFYINRKITGALVGRQPFGGTGMSGVGSKAGGPDYLLQFMNPRCISENTMRRGFAPLD
jgi:RHH-type proline utilization regulon transcriptional repressor/proline dehydrogenase/delta 1-pyrroline-5-carboxylate dehydrogenase